MISPKEFAVKYNRFPTEVDPDWLRELELSITLSRIQVLDYPVLAPGKCSLCGSSTPQRKYIDLGVDIEEAPGFHMCVYVCSECIKDVINVCKSHNIIEEKSLPPVATASQMNKELLSISDTVEDIINLVQKLRVEFDGFFTPMADIVNDPDNVNDRESDSDTDVDSSESETQRNGEESDSTEPRTDKQDTGGGSSHVPTLEELLGRPKFESKSK